MKKKYSIRNTVGTIDDLEFDNGIRIDNMFKYYEEPLTYASSYFIDNYYKPLVQLTL